MPRFIRSLTLFGVVATVCLLTAASAQATHPRPKGATPMRMSLVPAYAACVAPNRTHGPSLAFASCNPPAQTSAQATLGTPDAFGGAANSIGYLLLRYWHCRATAPEDDDMRIDIALNDVRCVPTGARCGAANASGPADYSGEMRFSFTFRLTDHCNAVAPGGGTDTATVQDFTIEHSWACVQSGSTSIGSTCNLSTSLKAVSPGAVGRKTLDLGAGCRADLRWRCRRRRRHHRGQHGVRATRHLHPVGRPRLLSLRDTARAMSQENVEIVRALIYGRNQGDFRRR